MPYFKTSDLARISNSKEVAEPMDRIFSGDFCGMKPEPIIQII
jgi:hypothetical protein